MTAEHGFEELAAPLLVIDGITRSTMMGLPCLRLRGAFFAALDRRTGALLVKLSPSRVEELLFTGTAEPFAPAGRRFRQWAAVPAQHAARWPALLDEARQTADDPTGPHPTKGGQRSASRSRSPRGKRPTTSS